MSGVRGSCGRCEREGEEEIERILLEVEMGFVAWSVGGGFMAVVCAEVVRRIVVGCVVWYGIDRGVCVGGTFCRKCPLFRRWHELLLLPFSLLFSS